jgi:hypothetical protein
LSQFSLINGGGVQTISEGLDGDEKHLAGVLQQSSFGDAGHGYGPHAELMLPFSGISKKQGYTDPASTIGEYSIQN